MAMKRTLVCRRKCGSKFVCNRIHVGDKGRHMASGRQIRRVASVIREATFLRDTQSKKTTDATVSEIFLVLRK